MPYIPHTDEDINAMLARIGVRDTETLFDEIPQELRNHDLKNIPAGISEMSLLQEATQQASANQNGVCFIGAGSYDHHIPAAVWDITSRGEFLTAYTPYQAEASQGTLQLLYEFQTMMAELTGMEVSNASMYDGATALAEAVLMAVRINKHSKTSRILVAGTVHPFYRDCLKAIVCNQHIEIITLPFDQQQGITALSAVEKYNGEDITALVIAQPNFFGCLEEVDALTDWAAANQVISVACVNPISLALLKPPGSWGTAGVDIACGEGQPLGSPMASGGPYFGFFTTRLEHVRQMPGRLIGRTLDKEGKTGYTLTLQAREQHIRRAKATSNICTNQGLLVTAATIHLSLLGSDGLQQVARHCHQNTRKLIEGIKAIKGVKQCFTAPFFHECLVQFDRPTEDILQALHNAGIAGGYPLASHYPNLPDSVLICVTEMRSEQEINHYIHTLQTIMSKEK